MIGARYSYNPSRTLIRSLTLVLHTDCSGNRSLAIPSSSSLYGVQSPHPLPLLIPPLAATMPTNMSLFSINAILLTSTDDSSRLLAKYYSAPHPPLHSTPPNSQHYAGANPYPTLKEQKAFEKGLLEKTTKTSSDVILYDNRVVVFKMEGDVMMYVVGGADENEILLFSVVLCLRDSLSILLK